MPSEVSIPENILQPFLAASNAKTLDEALENLVELARTSDGRADLATKNVLTATLHLLRGLLYPYWCLNLLETYVPENCEIRIHLLNRMELILFRILLGLKELLMI